MDFAENHFSVIPLFFFFDYKKSNENLLFLTLSPLKLKIERFLLTQKVMIDGKKYINNCKINTFIAPLRF